MDWLRSALGGTRRIVDERACGCAGQELYRVATRCASGCWRKGRDRLTVGLAGERIEARRYAAVLVLRELTRAAPALVYDHVSELLDNLWTALRDPKVRFAGSSSWTRLRRALNRSPFVKLLPTLSPDAFSSLLSATTNPRRKPTTWSSNRRREDSSSTRPKRSTDLCSGTRSCSSRERWCVHSGLRNFEGADLRNPVHARAIRRSLRPDPPIQGPPRPPRATRRHRAHPHSRILQPRRIHDALPPQDDALPPRSAEEGSRSHDL